MESANISIDDFDYLLPEERIALYPLQDRDASRLLVYQNSKMEADIFKNIGIHLLPGTLLIFNNTRVVEARLIFQKPTGGRVEIFCLEPDLGYPDLTTALQQTKEVTWLCLIGGASKWKKGQVLEQSLQHGGRIIRLQARYLEKKGDSFSIGLSWDEPSLCFAEILHLAGQIPLPPYIKRSTTPDDARTYQTVYAEKEGSVAAPTAGLHFTTALLDNLNQRGIEKAFLTLHVGAGTFKPVTNPQVNEHEMHAEWIDVSLDTLDRLKEQGNKSIAAVGTTSLRTLESLYWIGVKIIRKPKLREDELALEQWEAYELDAEGIDRANALSALINYMKTRRWNKLVTRTRLMIVPGYNFQLTDMLVTNFHQPRSTLLLLVAAFIGADWKSLYRYALEHDFRFLSYGDGCLLFRQPASPS